MAKLLATDGEGERLDRFELVAELASGGMATVYLARLSGVAGFQRLVAIKRLHPHLAKEPEFIEMFLDEARLAARIHHPNVVPIQEVGESKQGYYLVMDYVEGDTLARLLSRAAQSKRQIPYGVTIRILLDSLAGLHAAHELTDDLGQPLAIVHRDISPQNILVGTDGISRITDFGVARAASRLSTTRSGQLKGKLSYMSPEQARGDDVDRRADIFSCGIVLWEALAVKRLFKGDGEAATLNRVLYDPIAPPSTVRPDIPKELEAIAMRALERDVDKRYKTAADFAEDLERVGRQLSCVGSVKDVATCLENVFGADLQQQRDAVRSWLARSEPSAVRRPTFPESVATRVERGASEPSRPYGSQRFSDAPATGPRPEGQRFSSMPPENVSSVSSTVLPLQSVHPTGSFAAPRRSPLRVVAVVLLIGLTVGIGVFAGTQMQRTRTVASTGPDETPAPPASSPLAAPSAPPSEVPSARPEAEPPTSVATKVEGLKPKSPPGGKRVPVVTATKPTASPAGVPDDLSKNPYR